MSLARIQTTKSSSFIGADIAVILLFIILGVGFINFLDTASAPYLAEANISTQLSALPRYTLLSLTRSCISLVLSIIFAVGYGTLAARSVTWERTLIPLLDVLQSLPVIAFLPGFVLALISIFENSRWGLEFACLLTIFVGQVWNLAFAYFESQRLIPQEFKEVAGMYKLSTIHRFFRLDFPSGYRPLIYNGMMSMAGGWFFLTTCEAFTLGHQNFRLPGLGSYLAVTFFSGNYFDFSIGILALLLVILCTDFIIWRPLIAWVNQFNEDIKAEKQESFVLDLLRSTRLPALITSGFHVAKRVFSIQNQKENDEDSNRYIPRIVQDWMQSMGLQDVAWKERAAAIGRSRILSFVLTFAVGGLVFSLLPKLPSFAQSLARISANDWFELMNAVFITASKVMWVLLISSLWTVPLGIFLGLRRRLEKIAQPIIQNLAAFPAPVIFPLITMLLYHFHLNPYINSTLLMCIGSQWYILFNVIGAASRIPGQLLQVSRMYRFKLLRRFFRVYFPAVLPSLITGWITAAGGAWNASMVAEIVELPHQNPVESSGIGAEFMKATTEGNYPRLVAGIICLVVALVILNRTVWKSLQQLAENVRD